MTELQDILAEYADGLITGETNIEKLRNKYNVAPHSELDELLQVAAELQELLVMVTPAPQFVSQLRDELLGKNPALARRLVVKFNRTQLAAGLGGLTVAAGMLWYAKRTGIELRLRPLETLRQASGRLSELAS